MCVCVSVSQDLHTVCVYLNFWVRSLFFYAAGQTGRLPADLQTPHIKRFYLFNISLMHIMSLQH